MLSRTPRSQKFAGRYAFPSGRQPVWLKLHAGTQLLGTVWKRNMSSPSIPFSGSPHPKAHGLFVTVAILFAAIAAGLGAFWVCTFFGTTDLRSVSSDRDADLVWLRREFDLTDVQFQRIRALHTAYAAKCDLMYQRTMNANAALDAAISRNKQVTPEVQQAMGDDPPESPALANWG